MFRSKVATTKCVYYGKTYIVKHRTPGSLAHLPPDLIDTVRRRGLPRPRPDNALHVSAVSGRR